MEFLCTNCFKKINQNDICPYCNKPLNRPQDYPFLPVGTSLANRYIVGNALKMDGEGLSYVGFDKTKNSKVFAYTFGNSVKRVITIGNLDYENPQKATVKIPK